MHGFIYMGSERQKQNSNGEVLLQKVTWSTPRHCRVVFSSAFSNAFTSVIKKKMFQVNSAISLGYYFTV